VLQVRQDQRVLKGVKGLQVLKDQQDCKALREIRGHKVQQVQMGKRY
jgi:hypothetical protein